MNPTTLHPLPDGTDIVTYTLDYLANEKPIVPLVEQLTSPDATIALVAYVLHSDGSDRWSRVKRAHKLCAIRGLNPVAFFERVYATADMHKIDVRRMRTAVAKLS